MTWISYQATLKRVLLAEDVAPGELRELGGQSSRWQAYRRMARARFYQTIDHAFERLIGAIGAERFRKLVDKFLAEDPPRSPYLRDLPGEFLRFVERRTALFDEPPALPPYALDLMRYEWAELDVAYAHEEVRPDDVVPLDMERSAVLSPAHRLLDLEYPVHTMGTEGAHATLERVVTHLCLYRDRNTHDVETLELTPVAATMLGAMARAANDGAGATPLVQVVRHAAERHGSSVDVAFVEALSTLLADLTERGVLLGSRA
jgi:hypothetical protein